MILPACAVAGKVSLLSTVETGMIGAPRLINDTVDELLQLDAFYSLLFDGLVAVGKRGFKDVF